ncbi:MAG: CDF family Co(II)/Ni(II) efflux transporter DmeF [Anaerolineae bacterium]|nr:CDF family Co(II)/Ni(II) efflux transporter DmeF [Anaerolineae bacterium]
MSFSSNNTPAHTHHFGSTDVQNERRTRHVVLLTLIMMIIEIAAGWKFGSMALLADGWHMGTHAGALGISLFAYVFSRRNAHNPRFTFGSGKVSVLGGYTSAVVLLVVALLMASESIGRLFNPRTIQFDEAILVAVLGLLVNLLSAFLLTGGKHAHLSSSHDEAHHTHLHHDHNLRAAYLHVLADALTSLLAIFALTTGKVFGWVWMDALMGLAGAAVITRWSLDLIKPTAAILLDSRADSQTANRIYAILQNEGQSRVTDLHLWHLDSQYLAAEIALETPHPQPAGYYKTLLTDIPHLAHITIEVNRASE